MREMSNTAAEGEAPAGNEVAGLGKAATLGQLVPGLIHELNNPLFAILGLVELLLGEADPTSRAYQRLTLMQQSGLEIKEIVSAVRDFAREPDQEHHEFSLEDVARQALELYRLTSVARDVETAVEAEDGPLLVLANPNRVKQIFLQLLGNAYQAMPDGGSVTVRLASEGDWVEATVSDSGVGVDPELRAHVFEPFVTTRQESGSAGLGLTLARAIAADQGGELELLPSRGTGTSFKLRLPAAPTRGSAPRSR
jgi:signal transduction histidine kinase